MRAADSSGSGEFSQRHPSAPGGSSSSLYSKGDANIPLETLRGKSLSLSLSVSVSLSVRLSFSVSLSLPVCLSLSVSISP